MWRSDDPRVGMDPGLQFREPRLGLLLDYWNRKRGDRAMPRRDEIDPAELKPHLRNLVLIDVEHEPLRLRYRLLGTAITEAMQRDNTGRYYDELYDEALLQQIYATFRWIFVRRAPLRTFGRAFYDDRDFYGYEIVNLPLSEDGVTVSRVLGELVFHLGRR